jgi:lipopolysaccharide biosynthesis glycosyltransferase
MTVEEMDTPKKWKDVERRKVFKILDAKFNDHLMLVDSDGMEMKVTWCKCVSTFYEEKGLHLKEKDYFCMYQGQGVNKLGQPYNDVIIKCRE